MLHYVIFAIALVSSCTGEDPATPVLENELVHLTKLMDDIEARINATATGQISSLTNASLACWALNLAGFKNQVENAFEASLSGFRSELQTDLSQAPTMTQEQLDQLENSLVSSSSTGLTMRMTAYLQSFQSSVTTIYNRLSQASSFTCTS